MVAAMWSKVRGFVDDVVNELKRTSWPSRAEVQGTTFVAVVTVVIVATYLGVVDAVLGLISQGALRQPGAK